MTRGIKEFITQIKNDIRSLFGERIVSFVFFGTSRSNKVFNDIDLELLLNEPQELDLKVLNELFLELQFKYSYKVDFHLSYRSQLEKLGYFRRKAQGSYLLWSLAKGDLLLGDENYFAKMLKQTPKKVAQRDLFIKNQEYQYSLREFLLETNFLSKRSRFSKYLLRYLIQIAIVSGQLSYNDVLDLPKNKLLKKVLNLKLFSLALRPALKTLYGKKKMNLDELLCVSSLILQETDNLMLKQYKKIYE